MLIAPIDLGQFPTLLTFAVLEDHLGPTSFTTIIVQYIPLEFIQVEVATDRLVPSFLPNLPFVINLPFQVEAFHLPSQPPLQAP